MSTPQRGLDVYRVLILNNGDPRWRERYINLRHDTILIKTSNGLVSR